MKVVNNAIAYITLQYCKSRGLKCAVLPMIFQFKHGCIAVMSHLVYTVDLVGDRDHYREMLRKTHYTLVITIKETKEKEIY